MDDPDITMEEYVKFKEERSLSNNQVYDWKRARYGAQVIETKEITMEEYLILGQEKSRKERNKLPFQHTWCMSNDDEEDSYTVKPIPAIVIDSTFSPEIAQDDVYTEPYVEEYSAIVLPPLDNPTDEDEKYSNFDFEPFDAIVYDDIPQPDFDPTRDFEEIWHDLFKNEIRDDAEIARPLVKDGDSQD